MNDVKEEQDNPLGSSEVSGIQLIFAGMDSVQVDTFIQNVGALQIMAAADFLKLEAEEMLKEQRMMRIMEQQKQQIATPTPQVLRT